MGVIILDTKRKEQWWNNKKQQQRHSTRREITEGNYSEQWMKEQKKRKLRNTFKTTERKYQMQFKRRILREITTKKHAKINIFSLVIQNY